MVGGEYNFTQCFGKAIVVNGGLLRGNWEQKPQASRGKEKVLHSDLKRLGYKSLLSTSCKLGYKNRLQYLN